MADNRTFTLIGDFQDNITPSLDRVNRTVASLNRTLNSLGGKGARGAAKDLYKLTSAFSDLSKNLREQNKDLRNSIVPLQTYRKEVGRTVSAVMRLNSVMGNASGINRANLALRRQLSLLNQINRANRKGAGSSAGAPPGGSGRGGSGFGGGGGGRSGSGSFAAATGGAVAGNQLGNMITSAIVSGFQLGTTIMMKPFQYGASAFAERIRDEMTDIQSAGGLYAVDRRKNMGMFRDFQEARAAQEAINYRLSKSAAALPGSTAEYVQQGKRITDTIINTMAKNPAQFAKLGEEYGAKPGDKLDAFGAIIQKFTEKAVLLGKGTGGGARSLYGMPQVLEMMVNAPSVNAETMGRKYAVLRDSPLLISAIKEAENEINRTGANTADRLKILMKVLDEALPNNVVQGMKNSMDGIIEVIRSSFLDPEVGLFGLGRKFEGIAKKVDQYGRFVNAQGKVVTDMSQAADDNLSLFMLLRDIIGGFALPLGELAQILPSLYDPLKKVGLSLADFRNFAQKFYSNFNQYTADFELLAKTVGGKAGAKIKSTAGARGALLTVADLLTAIGAIKEKKFDEVNAKLGKADVDLSSITGDLFKTLLNSDFMGKVGEMIGSFVGTVIKTVGDLMAGVTDFTNAGPFAKGLKRGWDKAQGTKGISEIFKSLFKIIGNLVTNAFKSAPFEMSVLTALTAGMPIITGAISSGITKLFELVFSNAGKLLPGVAAGAGAEGVAGGAAAAGEGMLKILGPIGLVAAALVRIEGPASSFRQILDTLYWWGGNLASNFKELTGILSVFIGKGEDLTGNFDLISAALLPFTTTLDLFEVALRGLRISTLSAKYALLQFRNWIASLPGLGWIGQDKTGEQETLQEISAATKDLINKVTVRDPAKYTSVRYGGREALGNKYELDIAAKRKKLSEGVTDPDKFYKLNQDIAWLQSQLKALGVTDKGKPAPVPPQISETAENTQRTAQASAAQAKTQSQATTKIVTATNGVKTSIDSQKATLMSMDGKMAQMTASLMLLNNTMGNMKFPSVETPFTIPMPSVTPGSLFPLTSPPTPPLSPPPLIPRTKPSKTPQADQFMQLTGGQVQVRANGGLGDAIASEMKNKPPGSDLVIANSSETVIPAAGGLGMKAFIDTIANGFSAVNNQFLSVANSLNILKEDTDKGFKQTGSNLLDFRNNTDKRFNQTNTSITNYNKETQTQIKKVQEDVAALSTKMSTMSPFGGMMGGAGMELGGGYGGAGVAIAGQLGNYIKATGGAPGSIWEHPWHGGVKGRHSAGSYHYSGRAIDIGAHAYEQAGVIARIKAFNAKMGVKPVEFLHAGNDRNHQDHVHVAYNQGNMAPLLQEMREMPRGSKVAAVNSSEFVANKEQTALLASALQGYFEVKKLLRTLVSSQATLIASSAARQPTINPVINPVVNQPSINPVVNPVVNQPSISPIVNQPSINPFVSQPTIVPEVAPAKVSIPSNTYGNQQGGPTTVSISAPITIHQQPGQDADELASLVALKIGEAVADARAASIFV